MYFLTLLSPMEAVCGLFINGPVGSYVSHRMRAWVHIEGTAFLCASPYVDMGLHLREGIGVYDLQGWPCFEESHVFEFTTCLLSTHVMEVIYGLFNCGLVYAFVSLYVRYGVEVREGVGVK